MKELKIILGSSSIRQWLSTPRKNFLGIPISYCKEGLPGDAEFVRFESMGRDHIVVVYRTNEERLLSDDGYYYPLFEGRWLPEEPKAAP